MHPVTKANALRQLVAAARYRAPASAPVPNTLLLAAGVVTGSLVIERGLIQDVQPGASQLPNAHDLEGDLLLPGMVELHTDDPDALPDLCEKLLANPLIEDYEIEILDG